MIGPRVGAKIGIMGGSRFGVGADQIAPQGSATTTTLTAAITASANPTPSDANFTYSVQIDNTGANQATAITTTVTLDGSLTYVSAAGTGWTCGQSGGVVTCTLATLNATTNANAITITVTAGNASNASVTSTLSAAGANTNTATGNSTIAVVQPTESVTIVDNLRVAGATLQTGPNFNYTVQYTNNGTGTIFGISVATTLDSSLTYVSSSGTGWTIGVVGQVVTATLASLAAGAANPITITVTPGAAASLSTGVSATSTNAATATATWTGTSYACVKDATSGIYCPASNTEWSNVMTVANISSGGPSFLWLCQDSASPLAETIGGTVTLAKTGTPPFQQSVSGWARKAVQTGDGTSENFASTSTSLPDVSATSALVLVYGALTGTPGATRRLFGMGTTSAGLNVLTTNIDQAAVSSNTANGTTALSGVEPWVLKITEPNACTTYTIADKLTPSTAAITGKKFTLGPTTASSNAPPASYLYASLFVGSAAALTDANVKILLQTLGWTITWS